jgi:hypothetical protein
MTLFAQRSATGKLYALSGPTMLQYLSSPSAAAYLQEIAHNTSLEP